MAITSTDLCNRALVMLGAQQISDLATDTGRNATACNAVFEPVRDSLLSSHPWTFATKLVEITVDGTSPDFGRSNRYAIPADCLRVLGPYPEDDLNDRDWQIHDGYIYTDYSTPLQLRYVYKVTDPDSMPPSFREALSAALAFELCEILTQSNSKQDRLYQTAKRKYMQAKRIDSQQQAPMPTLEGSWISKRA